MGKQQQSGSGQWWDFVRDVALVRRKRRAVRTGVGVLAATATLLLVAGTAPTFAADSGTDPATPGSGQTASPGTEPTTTSDSDHLRLVDVRLVDVRLVDLRVVRCPALPGRSHHVRGEPGCWCRLRGH